MSSAGTSELGSGTLRWKTKGCSFVFHLNVPAEGYELSNTTGPEGVGAAAEPSVKVDLLFKWYGYPG